MKHRFDHMATLSFFFPLALALSSPLHLTGHFLRFSTFISWAAETSILGCHGFANKIVFSSCDGSRNFEDTVAGPDACFPVDSSKTSESREVNSSEPERNP